MACTSTGLVFPVVCLANVTEGNTLRLQRNLLCPGCPMYGGLLNMSCITSTFTKLYHVYDGYIWHESSIGMAEWPTIGHHAVTTK